MESNNYQKKSSPKYKYVTHIAIYAIICFNFVNVLLVKGKISAYEMGLITGSTLTGIFIVFVLSLLLSKLLKIDKNKLIIIICVLYLIINTITLFSALNTRRSNDLSIEAAKQKIYSLTTSLVNGENVVKEDITIDKYGDLAETVELIQNYYFDIYELTNEYLSKMYDIDLGLFLSEKTIMNIDELKSCRKKINRFILDTEDYCNSIEALGTRFIEKSSTISTKDTFSKGFISGFTESMDSQIQYISEQHVVMEDLFIVADNILEFFQKRQGQYYFENSQLQLKHQEDIDIYNELVDNYNVALANLQQVEKESMKKLEDLMNQLDDLIK